MGHILLGMMIGLTSAIACTIAGNLTLLEAMTIYWIMGTAAPALHIALTVPATAKT